MAIIQLIVGRKKGCIYDPENIIMHTHRLSCFDGYKSVVALFPTYIAKGPVVRDILGNVGNLMNCMVVLKNLKKKIYIVNVYN